VKVVPWWNEESGEERSFAQLNFGRRRRWRN